MRSQKLSRKCSSALALAITATLGVTAARATTQNSTWTDGGGDSNWGTASNWSPSGVPNNGSNGFTDYNVTLGAPSPTNLNVTVTIDDLTVGTAGLLNIQVGQSLTLDGAAIIDNGGIVINSQDSGGATMLNFVGATVSGSGAFSLNCSTTNAQLNGTLTQVSTHTIQGYGDVNALLNNSGTVDASVDGQVLYLQNSNMTNSGTFEATNAATLYISGISVAQGTAGLVVAGTNSVVALNAGATVTGGTLQSVGNAYIEVTGGTDTIGSLTNDGDINVEAGSTLNVTGNLVDNDQIVINSGSNGGATILNFTGGNLTGTGAIVLNCSTTNAQINGTLAQSASHTIEGYGDINAALTNSGTVNANVNGQVLYLQTDNMTNSTTFEATNSGELYINGIAVAQGAAGRITAGTNSVVVLNTGSTVMGGTLTSVGNAYIEATGGTETIGSLTNDADINVEAGNTLNVTGNLVDNGQIVINPGSNGGATILDFTGGNLTGTGAIVLNCGTTNAQLNGTLVQSASHTIEGYGEINAALTNSGIVNSNIDNQTLYLQTDNMINSATFEATNAGTLYINGITLTQSATAQILAGTNSVVALNTGGTITGGVLNSVGNAYIEATGGTETIGSLTNDADISVEVGNTLNVTGNLIDNGPIVINPGSNGGATILNFVGGNLSGTGAIVLNCNTTNAQLDGTLTQAATHTIEGYGEINAVLTNNGIVNANVDGENLFLQTDNMTNSATFEATNGGTLNINGITITQSPTAQILAGTNCVVVLNSGATIIGATLNGSGNSFFQVTGSTDTISNLTNNATIELPVGSVLDVTGNLVNNATIEINPNDNSGATIVDFAGGTVSGTGSIQLGTNTTNAQLNGTLTQGATNTIEGFGDVNAALTNNGTVNANVSGQSLILQTNNMTNSATFEATNQGTLNISGITVTQGAAGQITAGSASSVTINSGATIVNGTLNSVSNGSVTVSNGTFTNVTISSGSQVSVPAGYNLGFIGTTLRNNGTLTVNQGFAYGGQLIGSGALVIQNSGLVRLVTGAGYSTLASLTINSNGKLDVTNNGLRINFGSPANDPATTIAGYLASGYSGGAWTGVGIYSSTAATAYANNATPVLSVGYADGNTDPGTPAAANQILVKYTLAGDANLDGSVNFTDLGIVGQHLNTTGNDWAHGNFTYDPAGAVTFTDLGIVGQNLNKLLTPAGSSGEELGGTVLPQSTGPQIQNTAVVLPEPNMLVIAATGAAGLLARRRRRAIA